MRWCVSGPRPPTSSVWWHSHRGISVYLVNSSGIWTVDRKSTRLNSSHTVIYTLSLHDALPIYEMVRVWSKATDEQRLVAFPPGDLGISCQFVWHMDRRSEEHTSELQSHSDLHSFPTRRSSDL